jgi:protein-S-isoprenylcysteine O-methyltransferase Ste14
LYLLPLAIAWGGASLDRKLDLPSLDLGTINHILGGFLMVLGFSFALWSIYDQFSQASGTPLPMLPTQKLLVGGPFRYCRNPMTLGTVTAYLGIAVYARTIAGIGIVLLFALLLVLYLKLLEEKELTERFGEAYLAYKQEVPFIIPRLPRRK